MQIAAAALWLKAQQVTPAARPSKLNLVASQLRLASLPKDDPRLVELRERVDREAGIPAAVTNEVVQALKGADHLGSLLKVGDALDTALEKYTGRNQPQQGSLLGQAFEPEQKMVEFSTKDAKERLVMGLEAFLAAHTGGADLGLRLRGEQLAAGVRFLRLVREGAYHLVVGNPPYQGTSKMEAAGYVKKQYSRGKADLYAAFLERGLEFVRAGGVSALLTMRNWMFIKQYTKLRVWLLENFELRCLGDLAIGAFDEVPNDVLSVSISVFCRSAPQATRSVATQPTPPGDKSYDRARTKRKRAATLVQVGRYEFDPAGLNVIPDWPLVYWWSPSFLLDYSSCAKLGGSAPCKVGIVTGNNIRFIRKHSELSTGHGWVPYVSGAKGVRWFEPCDDRLNWYRLGLETKALAEAMYGSHSRQIRGEEYYFRRGIACAAIGDRFGARLHWRESIIGSSAASVFPDDNATVLAALNSSYAQTILTSLNPTVHFEIGDINRLPLFLVRRAHDIVDLLGHSFLKRERHRETSRDFQSPGPSPWIHAQAWAQQSVDRPEGAPLPEYTEQFDPEPPTDHISFALGVALGRFGAPPSLGAKQGILDPATDDLSHALPHGILFLDGTLGADSKVDSLAHDACAVLREKWKTHGPKIETKRKTLRGYLRLDFFKDVHRTMYENRPIHWPLSSKKRTFVAWINIHRWHAGTLRTLLAEHLNEALRRLASELTDLRKTRDGADAKAARNAEKRLSKVTAWHDELSEFIDLVKQHAELGPDGRGDDATYDPDLDDGVMINSAALWPLLEPQWKDPKKWWKELVAAKGRKDYDWSHLARRYFRERVEEKCKQDPSLGVAHGCFWKYHPAKAYAWELRLQDEIGPDFTIDEDGSDEYRKAFLAKRAQEVREIEEKERKRRLRKLEKAQKAAQSELTTDA